VGTRVGVVSDIHSNRLALDAALADLDRAPPDRLVCLGDVAAGGPNPERARRAPRALGCPVGRGIADARLLGPRRRDAPAHGDAARFRDMDVWCAGRLAPDDLAFIGGFRSHLQLALGEGVGLLCYHGSSRSHDEEIVATTPDENLDAMVGGTTAGVLAGGQTHTPMLRRHSGRLVLNPGLSACPSRSRGPAAGPAPTPCRSPWGRRASPRGGMAPGGPDVTDHRGAL